MRWVGIGLISIQWFDLFGNDHWKIEAFFKSLLVKSLDDLEVVDMQ